MVGESSGPRSGVMTLQARDTWHNHESSPTYRERTMMRKGMLGGMWHLKIRTDSNMSNTGIV